MNPQFIDIHRTFNGQPVSARVGLLDGEAIMADVHGTEGMTVGQFNECRDFLCREAEREVL